jgi:hypothetical protein
MLIEVVRMAYFADEAPGLMRAAELIDVVPLPHDHPLRPMLRQFDPCEAAIRRARG